MGTENFNEEVEIDLIDLLLYLKRKVWLILLGLLIGVLLSGLYTFKIVDPMYSASSLIYMRGAGNSITSIQDLQIGAELTNDYEVIFTSRPILQEVIDELKLDMSYKELQSRVELSNPTDTRILKVELKDKDPKKASEIVNTLVQVSMDSVKEIDAKEPYLIEEAVEDNSPVSPSIPKNLALGALAGVALVGAILVIRYVANDRVCGEEDVTKALGIPVFCMIPENDSMSFKKKNRKKG
ncbi:MAG: YveK family protein [Blautia sp.]